MLFDFTVYFVFFLICFVLLFRVFFFHLPFDLSCLYMYNLLVAMSKQSVFIIKEEEEEGRERERDR